MINVQNNSAGPTPTGQWTDMRTGEVVTIKTMVDDMTGGGAQIMFSDNRVIPFKEFSMYYIQEDNIEQTQNTTIVKTDNQTTLNKELLMSGLATHEPVITTRPPLNVTVTKNKERQMVIDLLEKSKIKPTAILDNLTLDGIEPIKMLIEYFDVTVDDIADAIVDKYIDKNAIKDKIKEILINQNGKEK